MTGNTVCLNDLILKEQFLGLKIVDCQTVLQIINYLSFVMDRFSKYSGTK